MSTDPASEKKSEGLDSLSLGSCSCVSDDAVKASVFSKNLHSSDLHS